MVQVQSQKNPANLAEETKAPANLAEETKAPANLAEETKTPTTVVVGEKHLQLAGVRLAACAANYSVDSKVMAKAMAKAISSMVYAAELELLTK